MSDSPETHTSGSFLGKELLPVGNLKQILCPSVNLRELQLLVTVT